MAGVWRGREREFYAREKPNQCNELPNSPFAHRPGYLPPKILHNFTFSFLLGIAAVPREIDLGLNKVHFGRCASDETQAVADCGLAGTE